MTVGIAAIAEKKYVVICADKMISVQNPPTEYEPKRSKINKLTDSCVFSSAGLALESLPILKKFCSTNSEKKLKTTDDITKELLNLWKKQRISIIDNQYFSKFGMDLNKFNSNHKNYGEEFVRTSLQFLNAYPYNLEFLIAGVDSSGPHIAIVDRSGNSSLHDPLGYAAIGSGSLHALSSFITLKYNSTMSLNEVITHVYLAKKKSEVAPGVGPQTDIYIVGECFTHLLTEEELTQIKNYYDKKLELEKQNILDLQDDIANFKFQL